MACEPPFRMPVPEFLRSKRSVPSPDKPLTVTVYVDPVPDTAEMVPVADPVLVSMKSVRSTCVTDSLNVTV